MLDMHPRWPVGPDGMGSSRTRDPAELRDLAASGLPRPDIGDEAHEDRGDEAVCAWIRGPDRVTAAFPGLTTF
jgi:hypothetical protein